MPLASRSPASGHARRWPLPLAAALISASALLAGCGGSTYTGPSESAPPPMRPIDPTAPVRPSTPAPTSSPAPQAPPAGTSTSNAPGAPSPAVASGATAPIAEEPAPAPIIVQAGLHRCELARRVLVKRVSTEGDAVQINWNGKDYTMRSVTTRSGARRFEDSKAGMAWVVISVKAFLLDTKRGQMLANECKL